MNRYPVILFNSSKECIMSSLCCTNNLVLGCFSSCGNIDTGLNAIQNGTHTIEYYFLDARCTTEVTGVIGNPLVIPANIFNEYGQATFKIIQPDGSTFVSGTADCFIVTIIPTTVC